MATGVESPTSRNARRAPVVLCHLDGRNAECGSLVLQAFALVVSARRDHVVSRDVSQVIIGRDPAR